MTTWTVFGNGAGPSSGTTYTGNLVIGIAVESTAGGRWLTAYKIWLPPTGLASGWKFCLYQVTGVDTAVLVANSTVTPGTLTLGAWNTVPLAAPLLLAQNAAYVPAAGAAFTGQQFTETKNQFGSGDPDAGGITNGPLFAFSSLTGSAPAGGAAGWVAQEPFTTGGSDPTTNYPNENDSDAYLGMDCVLTDQAPAGASYQIWPNYPQPTGAAVNSQTLEYTLGTEFTTSKLCTVDQIGFYSPSGAAGLPGRASVWAVSGESRIIDIPAPSWSGAAGSGWVYAAPAAGTMLPPGDYVVTVHKTAGVEWFVAQTGYFSGTGQGAAGLGPCGPIATVPNDAGSSHGQGCYATSDAYPATDGGGEVYYADIVLTPASSPAGGEMGGRPAARRRGVAA